MLHTTFHVWYVFSLSLEAVWRFEQRTIHFGMQRGAKVCSVLSEPKLVALHSKFNYYLQACIMSGKKH